VREFVVRSEDNCDSWCEIIAVLPCSCRHKSSILSILAVDESNLVSIVQSHFSVSETVEGDVVVGRIRGTGFGSR
jgi:hypothetical protein